MLPSFLTTFLFSLSIVCGHRSAKLIGGAEANFWRLVCATFFLGIWSWGFGIGLGGESFPTFLMSGVLGIGLGDTALFQALPRLGSRLSTLLVQCLTAPIAAIIEWAWLGTSLTKFQIACGLTILAGVGLALSPSKHLKLTRRELWLGTIFSILAAVGGACGAVLSRKAYAIARESQVTIDGGNAAFQRILGGLFIAGICLLIAKRQAFRVQLSAPPNLVREASRRKWSRAWPWILSNSLAGQTLGVSCMQWAFETTPTGLVLAVIATTPIVVIPFAWVAEGERPTWKSLVGGGIAAAGVAALTTSR
ncbi:MAG TPA: DMT family transporter [Verrucomicrobiae bacterium]|nr:DMT family transporter [Verrucomicrobiae bacterium]